MNMQAMLKQAQKMQKDMQVAQSEIEVMEFTSTIGIVTVNFLGNKKLISLKINEEAKNVDDIEMLEDMITTAINNTLNEIEKFSNEKMSKYTNGMPGMF